MQDFYNCQDFSLNKDVSEVSHSKVFAKERSSLRKTAVIFIAGTILEAGHKP